MTLKKRFRTLAAVAAASLLALTLGACGKDDAPEKVRIGEVTRSIFYAPQYVALAKGYFAEQGLEAELTTIPGGDKTMTALLSGQIDVALVGSETSIYVHQQGSSDPVLNFAQLTQTDGTFLVARKPIPDFKWEQLKGTTFLGQRKGGMPQMAGEFTLKQKGIDPLRDLTLIQNVEFANIPAAFASGTGDFVQLFEPQATVIEREGKGHVIASFGVESGKLPYTVFMAKKSYMDKEGETIQKFTNAVHKAQKWVQSASAADIADAILPYFTNVDREVVVRVVERYKSQDSFALDPIVDETEWANLLDVMESAGELKQRAEYGKLVDASFAKKAIGEVK